MLWKLLGQLPHDIKHYVRLHIKIALRDRVKLFQLLKKEKRPQETFIFRLMVDFVFNFNDGSQSTPARYST